MLETIGRYHVKKVLGMGTLGDILEAFDPLLQRQVAIKTLRRSRFSSLASAALDALFQREARVAGLLHHPNIVPVYDAGVEGELAYLVLQLAPGSGLRELLRGAETPDTRQCLNFAIDLLHALEHAHTHGVLHLDVSPVNLLVFGSHARLTAFGTALILADPEDAHPVQPNSYSAPELILSGPLDARADIFSAGALLYEAVTGRHPFEATNSFLTLQRITSSEPPPASSLRPSLPAELDRVLARALARDLTLRYPSASVMRTDLEAILASMQNGTHWDEPTQPATSPAFPVKTPAGRTLAPELPVSTKVQEFEVIRTLATGGFGIVYLAHDRSLDRRVALKEYFPQSLARRVENGRVEPVPPHQAMFAAALESFYREAQLLAGLDHPSIVRVHRTFRENGTAYIAMPYYEGETVKAYVQRSSPKVDEAWLKDLLFGVGEALSVLHANDIYHRDIAPDNIILVDGRPVLLDFGAARQVLAGSDRTLTVILKHGFAPVEQYGGAGRQGAWTDIYALAAVAYYCVTGHPPPPAVDRMVHSDEGPPKLQAAPEFTSAMKQVIEAGLRVHPATRPQSMREFLATLGGPQASH